MPDFSHRSYQSELLDRPDIPFEDIRRNMQELETINRYLGGHRITLSGMKSVLSGSFTPGSLLSKKITICEIGCGGGDNLKAINSWCIRKDIEVHFIGIDINKDCISYARENCRTIGVEWKASDYREVVFRRKPDIIFSSLFCHHFREDALVEQLTWMRENASAGFFINDLHRHALAYYSIKWLTHYFSGSYLVKNDAPLSVLRGFIKREWVQLLSKAGMSHCTIQWKWAFRWLMVYINGKGRIE